jgi:hypothetical protein
VPGQKHERHGQGVEGPADEQRGQQLHGSLLKWIAEAEVEDQDPGTEATMAITTTPHSTHPTELTQKARA